MLVRPVSDEFGFEVIGHYRYGRGAFIDRGKIQIDDGSGSIANKINIQFAATGGLLTDGPSANTGGPGSMAFQQAFEDMRPDDYLTGASFDHGVAGTGEVQNISVTGQSTYDSAILSSQLRTGKAVFADADSTRRGLTLAELKPTLTVGDLSAGIEKCACALGKTDWLSVLPQSSLDQILKPFSTLNPNLPGSGSEINVGNGLGERAFGNGIDQISTTVTASNSQADTTSSGSLTPNRTPVNFTSFFDILNQYLVERFTGEYQSNASREIEDIGANVASINPNNDLQDNNVLGDPSNPLFNAAANGDPTALAALQQKANFNFGMTQQAASNFGKTAASAIDASRSAIINLPSQEGLAFTQNPLGVTIGTPAQQKIASAQHELERARLTLNQAEQFARDNPNSSEAQQALQQAQSDYARAAAAAATVSGQADQAAAVNRALSDVHNAQAEVDRIQRLLALDPNSPSIRLELQQANTDLVAAQQELDSAESGLSNGSPPPPYQPPAPPPTQGDILNPNKFGNAEGGFRTQGDPFAKT
jgi:hypothetical protein